MREFKIHPSQCHKIMGNSKPVGGLSVTAQTYLKEWYAGDNEPIRSKYIDKGNMVESDLIDFAMSQLGLGVAEKNAEAKENGFMVGTPDVVLDSLIIDVKAAWNHKTLLDAMEPDMNYMWQVQCYMELFDKPQAIIFHGLMDTPEMDWQEPINFDLPDLERWIAWKVKRNPDLIALINSKVVQCNEWLSSYHQSVQSEMGRVHETA